MSDFNKMMLILRSELRKYMRKIKRSDPTAACFIQYDKLYVNNKIFVFNDLQGKVGKVYWFMNWLYCNGGNI